MSLVYDIVYCLAAVLGIAAGLALYICWDSIRATYHRIEPHEQMRERTPWPPPPLPSDTGWIVYDKPRREPLALPRGDR